MPLLKFLPETNLIDAHSCRQRINTCCHRVFSPGSDAVSTLGGKGGEQFKLHPLSEPSYPISSLIKLHLNSGLAEVGRVANRNGC